MRERMAAELFIDPGTEMVRAAALSDDGLYRYRLSRTWDPLRGRMAFVMLNPSTADAEVDDPTIRRCVGFAKREGCGGIEVINLYRPHGGTGGLPSLLLGCRCGVLVVPRLDKGRPPPAPALRPGRSAVGALRATRRGRVTMADPTTVDRIAFAFHWEYERAAKRTGWATQSATQVPWDELPEANRQTMRATVAALLDLGVIAEGGPDHSGPQSGEGEREHVEDGGKPSESGG